MLNRKQQETMANKNPNPSTRFKPGESGNPNGISSAKAQLAHKVKASKAELKELFLKCLEMTTEQMEEFLARPDATQFELIYGRIVQRAANPTDRFAVTLLTDRLFGRVQNEIEEKETQKIVYQTSISSDGAISCEKVDFDEDFKTALKSLESYNR